MPRTLHGRIRGQTIVLDEDPGVLEGEPVQVTLIGLSPPQPGDGLLRTEGALANDPEWDAIMESIHRSRKLEQQLETPDLDSR